MPESIAFKRTRKKKKSMFLLLYWVFIPVFDCEFLLQYWLLWWRVIWFYDCPLCFCWCGFIFQHEIGSQSVLERAVGNKRAYSAVVQRVFQVQSNLANASNKQHQQLEWEDIHSIRLSRQIWIFFFIAFCKIVLMWCATCEWGKPQK